MTYKDLRRSIEVWTANSDPEFLSEIDRIIRQAEGRIGMLVKLPDYTTVLNVTASASVPTTSLTVTDFVAPDYIVFDGFGIVEKKSPSFIKEAYPDSTETGRPRYYAMVTSSQILWGPTPDQDYSASMEYFSKWPSIVDLGQNPSTETKETFISSKFEAGLLHACLYYSALFRQDPEGAQMEKQEMMDSLGLISKFGHGKAKVQDAEESNSAIADQDI